MNHTQTQAYHMIRGIISDEEVDIIDSVIVYGIITMSLVGVINNTINIRTFISMGLGDGITISLFGLALSDFGFTFSCCIYGCAHTLFPELEETYGWTHLPVAPKHVVDMFAGNIGFMFRQISCLTTTFIALARCMCVAMPFQFKHFFNRTKSASALVTFALVAISSYVPLLSQMGVQRKFDPRVNTTRFVLWMSEKRSEFKDVVSAIHGAIIIISCIVVTICIFIMAKHLKESGKFRHASTPGTTGSDGEEKQQYKLSGKELQVVKQVAVICTIYSVCLAPAIFVVVFKLSDKDFDFGKRLHNLYIILSSTIICADLISAATSFPVYYVCNSKFRIHCWSTSRAIKTSNGSGNK